MKRYSKNQLEQKAEGIFKKYPLATKLYATSDGQFFLEENRADLHVKGKKLSVVKVEKPIEPSNPEGKENTGDEKQTISIKDLKPIVKAMTDKEALTKMLEEEKALEDPRKSAIKLFEKRIAELETEDNGDGNTGGEDSTGDDTQAGEAEEAKLLETIGAMDSVEGLKGIEEKEQATETPRQAVLDAIQERITTLNKQ
jgi:hypothetical protein